MSINHQAQPVWQSGWWSQAQPCSSPNFGVRPEGTCIDMVVIHSISLPPGVYGGPEIEQLFCNMLDWDAHPYFAAIRGLEVSAHFVVRRQGQLLQFVSCDDRAWHSGRSVWQGRPESNDYAIGIELEGLEGDTFEPAQYATLLRLIAALREVYPLRDIVGHEHIAPQRKHDPGPGFDWELLRHHSACAGLVLAG